MKINGSYPPVQKITTRGLKGKPKTLTPTIHKQGSKLWNAFHNSAFVQGNDPRLLIQNFLKIKGIERGTLTELGVSGECVIPDLSGFNIFVLSREKRELKQTKQNASYVKTVHLDMGELPKRSLQAESCDLVVWHGAMLYFLKLFAGQLDLPLEKYEEIYGKKNLMTYKAIKGMYNILKKGGYFIEFYPFNDYIDLPEMLHYLKLKIQGIEFIIRDPLSIDRFEIDYISQNLITDQNHILNQIIANDATAKDWKDILEDILEDFSANPGLYIKSFLDEMLYSAMIIQKQR